MLPDQIAPTFPAPAREALERASIPPRLEAFAQGLASHYCTARWPKAEVYSIVGDAIRVSMRISKNYADPSCVELSQDELEAEARRKMIELFHGRPAEGRRRAKRPIMDWVESREELFRYVSTCFANHTRGLVHRHRFTAKRTGSVVPPKGSPELAAWNREHQKPETSFDAVPELRGRHEFTAFASAASQMQAVDEDMQDVLNPAELIVWEQMTSPNEAALAYAQLDAWRGGSPVEIKLTFDHHAAGVGLTTVEFMAIAKDVVDKFEAYRSNAQIPSVAKVEAEKRKQFTGVEFLVYQQLLHPNARARALAQGGPLQIEHLAYGLGLNQPVFQRVVAALKLKLSDKSMDQSSPAITALETVFEVQVPRSIEPTVVRRLFTLAARARAERVTPDVAALLRSIGAEAPELNSQDNLTCFGVLFSRNHHVCMACQARAACAAKAANFGLHSVSLHPTLLTARASVRTAEVIGPETQTHSRISPVSEREDEIVAYLDHHFHRAINGNKTTYSHRSAGAATHARAIVTVGRETTTTGAIFRIRFCNAAARLRAGLVTYGRPDSYYAADSMAAKAVCALIAQHADELFAAELAEQATVAVASFPPAAPAPTPTLKEALKAAPTAWLLQTLFTQRARQVAWQLTEGLRVRVLRQKPRF